MRLGKLGAMVTQKKLKFAVSFGGVIRQKRTTLGLTQEELAEQLDVHVTVISRLERGASPPSFVTLMKVSEALGTPLSELFRAAEALNEL
ncbi:helix-turn-helix transcriptional regulator [Imbroritus primus]|uniref:Helix-turn-helix transcriptional regulator n=1 Tax=Imbroritus primus TaxID=3058603 RepID=A0ACD3SM67_9BURK|nr:helix-turn-helix transcriptional regulator [Burkholderiaceae bacterium PBA]